MKILIIGAGGHAQVVADIILSMRNYDKSIELVGFLDDNRKLHGRKILGVRVLGFVSDVDSIEHDAVVVAIGDNKVRKKVFNVLESRGERFFTAIHPKSIVAFDVKLGAGCMICPGAIVNTGTVIGKGVIVNTGATVDHHCIVEDFVHIAPGVNLAGEVEIKEGALVGVGSAVLPRVKIGAWSIVGGGAVVIKDVEDNTLVVGVPAKCIRKM